MQVLIIGSGAREHCLAWKLAQSSLVDKLYCAPGNAGTEAIAENLDIAAGDIDKLLAFARQEKIDLTVVGPEAPLVEGIVDRFQAQGLAVFGPRQELALLEGSKVFAKEMMRKYAIPTADFRVFSDYREAKGYILRRGAPVVVKADGLAAGKGVFVCDSQDKAQAALDVIMREKRFGAAGEKVIIEECLEGEEASILVFTDGETILPLVASQDHKRAQDGDRGENTGGMGAYAPAPVVNEGLLDKVVSQVFRPLIEGLKKEGKVYRGMLYAGIMIKEGAPYVLEFNVRFGDPETQVVLPKLKTDLVEIMLKTIRGRLDGCRLEWDDRYCIGVVLASGGYPGSYRKGEEIKGLASLEKQEDVFVFHAGTKRVKGHPLTLLRAGGSRVKLLTSGGRVLTIAALGGTIKEAQDKVYAAVGEVSFAGMHYRRDIGYKALKFLRDKVK